VLASGRSCTLSGTCRQHRASTDVHPRTHSPTDLPHRKCCKSLILNVETTSSRSSTLASAASVRCVNARNLSPQNHRHPAFSTHYILLVQQRQQCMATTRCSQYTQNPPQVVSLGIVRTIDVLRILCVCRRSDIDIIGVSNINREFRSRGCRRKRTAIGHRERGRLD